MKIDENHFRIASKALELAVQSRVFAEDIVTKSEEFYKFLTGKESKFIEKPMRGDRFESLCIIIFALAKESTIDISKANKAAMEIVDSAKRFGIKIGQTTVRDYLKEVLEVISLNMAPPEGLEPPT